MKTAWRERQGDDRIFSSVGKQCSPAGNSGQFLSIDNCCALFDCGIRSNSLKRVSSEWQAQENEGLPCLVGVALPFGGPLLGLNPWRVHRGPVLDPAAAGTARMR